MDIIIIIGYCCSIPPQSLKAPIKFGFIAFTLTAAHVVQYTSIFNWYIYFQAQERNDEMHSI